MYYMLAISNIMEHTDILQIITYGAPICALVALACAWYIAHLDTQVLKQQLEIDRLALLEETEQKKKDRAVEAWRNAVSIDME